MKIVGITGSIGCGKTYIANILKKMGFSVFNPDDWVKNLYKNDIFLSNIKENFPECFVNNVFDKKCLRNTVFNDYKKLKKLENIIHPFLKIKLKNIIHKNALKTDVIFLDVAILLEMHWDIYCDFIILADVDKNIQKQRVIKRDNITEEDFEKINKKQMDNKLKIKYCDFIINTENKENIIKTQLINIISGII